MLKIIVLVIALKKKRVHQCGILDNIGSTDTHGDPSERKVIVHSLSFVTDTDIVHVHCQRNIGVYIEDMEAIRQEFGRHTE